MIAFSASNRIIALAVTDLPDPLSPTSANVSPFLILKDMPFTAFTSPLSVLNFT